MPDFPLVDSHVHLYDPAALDFPWMAGEPSLRRPHGLPEFAAATAGVAVEGIVFVEVDVAAGRHLDEACWVESHAGAGGLLRGMVGSLPLERGDAVAADLERFAALPHARGVRRLIQDRPPGFALASDFVAGVRRLARYGLTFDLCVRHGQLAEAAGLARLCPDVRFVLDHIGKPGIRDGLFEPWRTDIRALADLPNLWCKVSGVVTEADHARWGAADVAPFVTEALEAFGFDRCMFGGDWPVSTLASSYPRWVATLDAIVAGATEPERRSLFGGTATRFYRLQRI